MARQIGSNLLIKTVLVTVASGQTSGSSAADPEIASNAQIVGFRPATTDSVTMQAPKRIVLNADGSVTVTLGAAAAGGNFIYEVAVASVQF